MLRTRGRGEELLEGAAAGARERGTKDYSRGSGRYGGGAGDSVTVVSDGRREGARAE